MPDEKITVLIVDDQELIRSGFKAILDTYPDFQVVGTAKDGAQAVEEAQRLKPDVVLMDIRMPEKDGLAATRDITANPLLANTHVLVLTTFDIDQYVYDALAAGASGFLLKDADPDEMANAIRIVAKGDALIQPSVMRRLVETFVAARTQGAGTPSQNPASPASAPSPHADATTPGPPATPAASATAESATPATAGGAAPATSATAPDPAKRAQLKQLTDREREILTLVARGLSNDQIADELVISPATVKTHVARVMSKTQSHDRAQLVVFAYESGLMASSV